MLVRQIAKLTGKSDKSWKEKKKLNELVSKLNFFDILVAKKAKEDAKNFLQTNLNNKNQKKFD